MIAKCQMSSGTFPYVTTNYGCCLSINEVLMQAPGLPSCILLPYRLPPVPRSTTIWPNYYVISHPLHYLRSCRYSNFQLTCTWHAFRGGFNIFFCCCCCFLSICSQGRSRGVWYPGGVAVADLRGAQGTHDPPPPGPNSFNFMQFLGEIWQNRMLAPPLGEFPLPLTRNPGPVPE